MNPRFLILDPETQLQEVKEEGKIPPSISTQKVKKGKAIVI
jgi:hypothetical protein